MPDQRRADAPVSDSKLQRILRHAGRMEQPHSVRRDARRLLGRLGDHGVARHERRRHLAEEDRQREIPGADTDEDAAALQLQPVLLARGAGEQHARVAEVLARLGRVVAAEIDGLAQLRDRIVDRLAAFVAQQRQQRPALPLQRVGHAVEAGGAGRSRRRAPGAEGRPARRNKACSPPSGSAAGMGPSPRAFMPPSRR